MPRYIPFPITTSLSQNILKTIRSADRNLLHPHQFLLSKKPFVLFIPLVVFWWRRPGYRKRGQSKVQLLVQRYVVDAPSLPAQPGDGAVPPEELLGVQAGSTVRHEDGGVDARTVLPLRLRLGRWNLDGREELVLEGFKRGEARAVAYLQRLAALTSI